jgi:pimeloyl-ACP methyl ester carboxylesterase
MISRAAALAALVAAMAAAAPSNGLMAQGLRLSFSVAGDAHGAQPPVLFVALHGDLSSGGPADYQHRIASAVAGPGIVGVGLIRPGYADSVGRSSDGAKGPDTYTSRNIDAVADVIAALKARFGARRVVALGHSGGAAHVGVIIGRRPGLVDSAILVSCPCDISRWRMMRGARPWPNSLSPQDVVASVPATTRVIAITGDADANTVPALAQDYVAALRARGVAARVEIIPAAGHDYGGALRAAANVQAVAESR